MNEIKISNEQYLELLKKGCPVCNSQELAPYEMDTCFALICLRCSEETQHEYKQEKEQ
jgi:hypothetical protein